MRASSYSIFISQIAEAQILGGAEYIGRDSAGEARKWLRGMRRRVDSLAQMPARFPLHPIEELSRHGVRAVAEGSYTILYRIDEENRTVAVLAVWHMVRRPPNPIDLSL